MSFDKLKQDYKFLIFSSSQIFGGAKKKSLRRGLYFFPFGQKIILSWAKKKYLVGQTPKLIHSRYALDDKSLFILLVFYKKNIFLFCFKIRLISK
jgi:hypothetical protein